MKRITITLEDDVEKALSEYIGNYFIREHKEKSWKEAINELLRKALIHEEMNIGDDKRGER